MKHFLLPLALSAAAGAPAHAQASPPGEAKAAPAAAPVEAKPKWPKLSQLQTDRVGQLLANFRLANPELHAKSVDELVALGAGAAPVLLARFTDAKSNQNEWLARVLDQVTAAEHAPLLAAEAAHEVIAHRRYCVGRLVELAAPDTEVVFTKALADKDEEVAYRAAVGLLAQGRVSGFDRVLARVKRDWTGCRAWLEPALSRARHENASKAIVERMPGAPQADKVALLRLFRSAGVRAHAGKIAVELDANDHGVKREAINALRVVVLGEKPIDDLSVFQAIEMAKELKGKL